jgi:hypothetical protein
LAWERAWQKELDVVYVKASIAQLKSVGKEGQRLATSSSLSTEPSISVFQFNHPTLCRLQQDLLDLAAEKCVVDNFEDKWRAAGPKEREKHYFEAMKRVCRMPDMEKQRRCVVLFLEMTKLIATLQLRSRNLSQRISGRQRAGIS